LLYKIKRKENWEKVKIYKNEEIMSENLYDTLRKYEFNKTEPETLSKLVESAIKRGDESKELMATYSRKTSKVLDFLNREKKIEEISLTEEEKDFFNKKITFGVDGSVQVVGGIGGISHAPTSCSLIIFDKGIQTTNPKIIIEANIEEIRIRDPMGVKSEATTRMMRAESKAIAETSFRIKENQEAILFIDGPVIDPPTKSDDEYVEYRCNAIKKCLDKNFLVIGVVKGVVGRLFLDNLINNTLTDPDEIEIADKMYSDINLFCHIFTKIIKVGSNNILYSKPFNLLNVLEYETPRIYQKYGLEILTVYLQKDIFSKPIRIDIAIDSHKEYNYNEIAQIAVKAVCHWTPPGSSIPLPIIMAHLKCNIRIGCAEVLYNEIITRMASSDPIENLIKVKLLKGVY
jgi:hypothetical protein